MTTDPARLDGLIALVVGGGGAGIGHAVSRELARAGANTVVADLEAARAQAVVDEIVAAGHQAQARTANVLDPASVDALVADVWDSVGPIDAVATVVGGNRGLAPWQRVHDNTDKQWDDVLDLNLKYVFYVVRALLPRMAKRGQGGAIVSIGSLSGVTGSPNHFAYGLGKAGVIHLAKSVAIEYGREGIRMNVVSPGRVNTPATSDTLDEPTVARFNERIPLGRIGVPQDIASAVRFFASPASSYINGQNLMVDGGVTARFPMPLPGTDPSEAF